jgi:carbonic anhydrase/acetyltransferase-like protein (isoleucine patch superfamily)
MMDMSFAEAPKGKPVMVGRGCIVSHGARLHGCTIQDSVLVGIGAIVLDNAVIGEGSIVAAGSVVSPSTVVPGRSFVVGVPGKVTRRVTDDDFAWTKNECKVLVAKAAKYRGQC